LISFNNHIRRNLPAIFLLVFLLFLPSCRYLKQKLRLGEYSLKSAIEWARRDSTRVADSLRRVIVVKEDFEKTLTDSLMSIGDANSPGGDHQLQYYIIVGSFGNHDNALSAAGKYTSQGFKTSIIRVPGTNGTTLEVVSVKSFTDYNEAADFLKGFKGIFDPAAWIYTRK
jgi:hypothetical protein